jgi:hypothetical protein
VVFVKLKDKVRHALDEARMLIMGVQVLLGFNFEVFFMRRFEEMPRAAHALELVSTALLLCAILLLLAPGARHRLVERGEDSRALDRFTRHITSLALLPFALALGIDFFVVICRVLGAVAAAIGGALATAAAIAAWYFVPFAARRPHSEIDSMEPTSLNDKIKQVMTEVRVVMPGTQALLGFQFMAVLQEGFDVLPMSAKLVHIVGLGFLGASVVLLVLPAAYHRIAEGGELSERLHTFSSRALIAAMIALACGLACDIYVVLVKAIGSQIVGITAGIAWLLASLAAWIGYASVTRHRQMNAVSSGA